MSLRETIRDYFSLSDLKNLCFDLNIDFEELPPGNKSDSVRGLLEHCEQHGRLDELIAALRHERPDLIWPDTARPLTRTDLWGPPERTPFPFEPEFTFVPAGPFLMGSPDGNSFPVHETPQHELILPSYYIGRLPITNSQYAAFVRQANGTPPAKVGWFGMNPPRGKENHPVVGVSWDDARAYCSWLSELTDSTIRLPSEAEWEKAARGEDGRPYPWGESWEAGRCNLHAEELTAADAFPEGASPYGCLDMVGNAAEWTSTLWGRDWLKSDFPYPYDPLDGREEIDSSPPTFRIFRGNTLGKEAEDLRLRCSARSWYAPDNRDRRRGFRVVMAP